jgi:flavin-dependent dehydrogenase
MSALEPVEAVVIGAGIAGLTCALQAAPFDRLHAFEASPYVSC